MLRMYWQIERLNSNMKVLESRANASDSLVRAFLSIMYSKMSENSPGHNDNEILDGEAIQQPTYNQDEFYLCQEFGNSYINSEAGADKRYLGKHCGILVGTGQSGITVQEFQMESQIDHGYGAGELIYMGGSVKTPVVDGIYTYVDFDRIFSNESGGNVTVKELGISVWNAGNCFLICRDVLGVGEWQTVADGEYLRVTYRMRVST